MQKDKALEMALGQIEKQYGKGAIMLMGDAASRIQVSVIPTGCIELDAALGVGGVPRGRIVEIYGSFLFVVVLGAGMAVLLWTCPRLAKITEPYLVVLNSLPKSALAPLLIVWLGANERTIIVCGMSVAIFGSILNLYTGFGEADPEKLKLIETLGGGKKEKLMKIILPSSVPLLLSVMKVNIGLCLVGVIIGEFIGARKGLGYLIIYSSQVFKLDWLLMSICILCIIAVLLYAIIGLIEKWYLKKTG